MCRSVLQGKQILLCLIRTRLNALTLVAASCFLLPDPHYEAKLIGSGELSNCKAPLYLEKLTVSHAQHMQLHKQLQTKQKEGKETCFM